MAFFSRRFVVPSMREKAFVRAAYGTLTAAVNVLPS